MATGSQSDLYQTLFQLSNLLTGHDDLESLCAALAQALRNVLAFDHLALALYDPAHNHLQVRAVSPPRLPARVQVPVMATPDHPAGWVWCEQKTVVLSPLDGEHRWPGIVPELLQDGIQGVTLVPLTAGQRRLGLLGIGSYQPFTPEPSELAFLERVASEVAVTIDSFLTHQALVRERDRLRVLFDITNGLVAKLAPEELFSSISGQLARVISHDFCVLTMLNEQTNELEHCASHFPGEVLFPIERRPILSEGLPTGEALATGKPVVVNEIDYERFPSPRFREYVDLGFRSSCSIPLLLRSGARCALDIARMSGEPFTPEDVDLLSQVGAQIAIAADNSMAYRELAELKDKLATEKLYLEDEIRFDQNLGNMIGESPAFQSVLKSIQIVAPTDATVLVLGETGTGKELVARALHDLSTRGKRSFIKVNCAAIPSTLLESELFGHEKGSFTGAYAQKLGRFELADKGTLFLDEVGEIPLELQSKLLRSIQEQEFERIGGNRTIRVDVRLIAATNRDLKQMVEQGKFRSDLYYRLHVFPLAVPPLRERRTDIPLLLRYFVQKYARKLNRKIDAIPATAMDYLSAYSWPGNIRELQNVVERSVIVSTGSTLRVDLPESAASESRHDKKDTSHNIAERERILEALRECDGVVAGPDGAAARLGMKRTTLQSRMKKLNINRQYH